MCFLVYDLMKHTSPIFLVLEILYIVIYWVVGFKDISHVV